MVLIETIPIAIGSICNNDSTIDIKSFWHKIFVIIRNRWLHDYPLLEIADLIFFYQPIQRTVSITASEDTIFIREYILRDRKKLIVSSTSKDFAEMVKAILMVAL